MSWQAAFKDSTTSVAFSLQLSKHMVAAMELIYYYDTGCQPPTSIPLFITAVKSLVSRGLVEHHDRPRAWDDLPPLEQMKLHREHRWYTFTPAGKCVFNLLVLAGLIKLPMLVLEEAA